MSGGGDWIDAECGGYPSTKGQSAGPNGTQDFRIKFLDTLNHLRSDGTFCDLTLKAGDTVLKVHKAILVAASPYFRCLLAHKTEKKSNGERLEFPVVHRKGKKFCDIELHAGNVGIKVHKPVTEPSSPNCFETSLSIDIPSEDSTNANDEIVELKDISGIVLGRLIDFIYTGELMLTSETISSVLHTASYFEMTPAVDACKTYIMENLKVTNFLNFLSLADSYDLDIADVAASHFSVFVRNAKDSFLNLDYMFFQTILSSEKLVDVSEEALCKLVLHWVYHDLHNRRGYLGCLLGKVRLCLIPPNMLAQVLDIDMVREDEKSVLLIQEALGYHVAEILQPLQHGVQTDLRTKVPTMTIIDSHNMEWVLPLDELERLDLNHKVFNPKRAANKNVEGFTIFRNFLFVACCGHHDKVVSLHRYDPRSDKWRQLATLEEHRRSFSLVASGKSLYIIGGINKKQEPRHTIVEYSITHDCWMEKQRMPYPFALHASSTHQGVIFCSGGYDAESDTRTSKVLYKFDPISNQWTQRKSLWHGRSRHSMVTVGDIIFIIGGIAQHLSHGQYKLVTHNVIEYYDIRLDEWTSCAGSTIGYTHVTACCVNSDIYVTGICQYGHEEDGKGQNLNDRAVVFKFNPIEETLTKLCSFDTSIGVCEDQDLYNFNCYSLECRPQETPEFFVDEPWAEELFGLGSYGLKRLSLNRLN